MEFSTECFTTLAAHIRTQVRIGLLQPTEISTRQRRANESDGDRLVHRVQSKCADGDVRAALRLLTSDDAFCQPSAELVSALQDKHPPAPPNTVMPAASLVDAGMCLQVEEADVLQAIQSMPSGSSGGLDGVRPIHLQQLVGRHTAQSGCRLLTSLTKLSNLLLRGNIPIFARDAMFGASLCALNKKAGGIRPIAVGSVYRRLASKIAAGHAARALASDFAPVQLGVGIKNGCEAAVHATRSFLSSADFLGPGSALIKIDVKNAFNSLHRDAMLTQVKDRCPSIYSLAHLAYRAPSPLYVGTSLIWSCSGVQQGDPLGPLLFALTINPFIKNLTSPLNSW